MKSRIYDASILIIIAVCSLFIGFYIGRQSASDIVFVPAVQDAYAEGRLNHYTLTIDLNKATVDDLRLLPGVEQTMAEAIIQYRKDYGDYISVKELLYVEGMTQELYDQIYPHVIIGG